MEAKKLTSLLVIGIALLFGGCAGLFEDDLDRSYQNGSLSAADYYQLKNQRTAMRMQAFQQQQQASQQAQYQQQQADQEWQQRQTENSRNIFATILATQTPITLQNPPSFPNATVQQKPNFPSGFDLDQMQKGDSVQTGSFQMGKDGKMWYEYRTLSGATYWSLPP